MKIKQSYKYFLGDLISVSLAWLTFNILRFHIIACYTFSSLKDFLLFDQVLLGQLLATSITLVLFYYSGYYNKPVQKSRLSELQNTFHSALFSSILLFIVFVINDLPEDYTVYYTLQSTLFLLIFTFVYIPRLIMTQSIAFNVHHGRIGYNTVIIGTGNVAAKLIKDLNNLKQSLGYKIIGCVSIDSLKYKVDEELVIGTIENIEQIINDNSIEEIIVALDTNNSEEMINQVYQLFKFNLTIKAVPHKFDILSGNVRLDTIYATPLVEITRNNLKEWEKNIKHSFDIVFSIFSLILLFPLLVYIAIRIKMDSKGPIFYKQERIGLRGHSFIIYKFRSMKNDAENELPQLSSSGDTRITNFGKFIRKYRLDELPQLWNVLKGDMSLVGPRPERKYFIDQIVKKAPFYYLLHKMKPGLTSWGMVKYGYAANVDQMIERMEYDLIYIENASLFIDIKIIIYTIRTVFTGKGI